MPQSPLTLPDNLPVPEDDGACSHLPGLKLPSVTLPATDGSTVDFSKLSGRTLIFCYPKTGKPGVEPPAEWDAIPGARGCTPQNCAFREEYQNLLKAGVNQIYGVSAQTYADQREAAQRLCLPYLLVSDRHLQFSRALKLPTFDFENETLIKRLTLIVDAGVITHVFYPVFPPDKSASVALGWLRLNPA